MPRRSWKNINPAILSGIGFPVIVNLSIPGTLGVANTQDIFNVPLCIPGDKNGIMLRLAEVQYHLGSLGATSGSTAIRIVKNGDTTNGILDSTSIAYNAASNIVQKDVRDVSGAGLPLVSGDNLRLDVTAIPGTASTNLKVRLIFEMMDISA